MVSFGGSENKTAKLYSSVRSNVCFIKPRIFFLVAGEEVKTVVVKIFPDHKRRQLIVDLRDFVLLLV